VIQLERFGKYEIIRKLGRSMTDVYLALDPGRNVRVVLKLIEQARDRYTQIVIEAERRGAQIQRQLHLADPRFLEIYDIGEENGCFFVAMEHFEGQTIAEVLQLEGRLSPKRAGRYAIAVLDQLDRLHAFIPDLDGHRRAVVHGDIKPSNIQIGAGNGNPDVRLLDFGIAKVITYTHNLTSHNLGSPTYCSPERLARGQVDAQADLWALGVSLYEMVAGSLPYQAQSTRKLENLIQSRRPPRALPGDCPARLRAIISKALAADIERRYASAGDFERDLRAFVEDKATVAEQEKMPAWDANETLRTEPPTRSLTSRLANPAAALRRELAAGAGPVAVGVLLGLFVVAPVSYWYNVRRASRPLRTADYSRRTIPQINADWNLFKRLERDNGFLGELSPAISLGQELRTKLAKAGDAVIERYRNGSDPALEDFDWAKARVCFLYAVQLDAADHEIRGKLALCDGYINLIANPKLPKAAASEANFLSAVWDLPQSPDPHLALARLYTFAFRNAGKASGEFAEAETRGFRIGPREHEQQGDGYLFRAEWALRQAGRATAQPSKTEEVRWLRQAARDLDRAQSLFEPIVGFSSVSAGLEQLDRDRSSEEAMRAALQQAQAQAEAKAKPKRPGRRRAVTGSRSGDN
jgi:serine/threonine protein kinase